MTKNLLIAAALFAYAGASAQCEEAVTAINEDFSEFTIGTSGVFPQECWTANTGIPMMYTEETEDQSNQFVVYYNATTAGATGYLVSPAVSNVDGNHTLSFTTWKVAAPGGGVPADNMLVQVGTLTDPDDYTTFAAFGAAIDVTAEAVNHADIVIPAQEGDAYIAFKIIAAGEHNAVAIDDVVWQEVPAACEAVTALDENFDAFIAGMEAIDQNCWTANAGIPLVYVDGEEGTDNLFPTFYAAGSANTAGFLVSPELSNIDGAHQLSFDAFKIGGPAPVTTIQVGTIATANDFASFVPVGEVLTLTADVTATVDLIFPASEHNFIAFKFLTDNNHGAAGVDNVVWEEVTAGIEDTAKSIFSIYPNPSNGLISLTRDGSAGGAGMVSVYNVTGAKVFETAVAAGANTQEFDLSSLSSGMYLVKFESGNATATKKLVIK